MLSTDTTKIIQFKDVFSARHYRQIERVMEKHKYSDFSPIALGGLRSNLRNEEARIEKSLRASLFEGDKIALQKKLDTIREIEKKYFQFR